MWTQTANASEVSIIVILAAKAKFSTTTYSEKVATNKCDIDGQLEIAIWPSKPEVLISENQNSNGKPGFSTTASSKKMSLGDSSNHRHPEMAAETGSTYISETMRDIIKLPMVRVGFRTIQSSKKLSAIDFNSGRQQEIAILYGCETGNISGIMTDSIKISTTNRDYRPWRA